MNVVANGKPVDLSADATVADLVERLGLQARWVVVERNGEPVRRRDFALVRLGEGDRLEVVRPVQGGGAPAVEDARLYLVCGLSFAGRLAEVVSAGVGAVQLREKDAEARALLDGSASFRGLGVPFVVNDRPDVALAAGADGVHLGQDDLPPRVAREILGPGRVIGRSTHTREQIDAALSERDDGLADYAAVGPVFETPTKAGRPGVGLKLVEYAARHADMPWFAIGGIDPSNVSMVAAAGARRVVVVRAITLSPDPVGAAAALIEGLR